MATTTIDVITHRSGRPENVRLRIEDKNGKTWSSNNYTSNGTATLTVPANEMYTIVLDAYSTNNRVERAGHNGKQSISIDLDAYKPR